MRKILLLAFGCLIALPALTQTPLSSTNPDLVLPPSVQNAQDKVQNQAHIDSVNAAQIPAERKFAIIEYKDNDAFLDSFYVKTLITEVILIEEGLITKRDTQSDTATLYLPADGQTVFVGTTEWHANAKYDTTWTETARIDDAATNNTNWGTMVNISKATNTTKPGVYNKSFTYVTVTTSASSIETKPIICDRLEFFGERFVGHGNVKVFVDDPADATKWIQVATLSQGNPPYVTDFSRMQPSFSYVFPKAQYNSPATAHRMKFETDPGNQYIIDFIRVVKMTLTPRTPVKAAAKK